MYCFFDESQKREFINISPGEYFVSGKGMPIYTLLSTCISIALFDSNLEIGGLNHFMISNPEEMKDEAQNIELLLEGLYKLGSKKKNIEAKIIGGSVLCEEDEIPALANVRFAEEFLAAEKIRISNTSTGGNMIREVYYYPQKFKLLIRKIQPPNDILNSQILAYRESLQTKYAVKSSISNSYNLFRRIIKPKAEKMVG